MKNKQEKREGFYMNINSEERKTIDRLQEQYAINISQAFKLFLKQLLEKMEKKV
jgi:hypothetical protein